MPLWCSALKAIFGDGLERLPVHARPQRGTKIHNHAVKAHGLVAMHFKRREVLRERADEVRKPTLRVHVAHVRPQIDNHAIKRQGLVVPGQQVKEQIVQKMVDNVRAIRTTHTSRVPVVKE